MKKILCILLLLPYLGFSQQGRKAGRKTTYGIVQFWDSTYFQNVQYNSGAGIVHLGIDTVTGSPTFGKLVRKTAGGATPTLQQVLDAGSTLTSSETVIHGANTLVFTGSAVTLSALTSSASSEAAIQSYASNSGGYSYYFLKSGATSSTITDIGQIELQTSGTAANGFGLGLPLYVQTSGGASALVNKIGSRLRNATFSTRTGDFFVTNVINAITDTALRVGDYVTLTESSATEFTTTTIATGKIQGGTILITVEANDATDYQSRTLRFIWSAVNKAGTLTITISTPEEVVALSSGTLTCTITAVDAGSGVLSFRANAVSSLTQSTLRATYQTFKNF